MLINMKLKYRFGSSEIMEFLRLQRFGGGRAGGEKPIRQDEIYSSDLVLAMQQKILE